MRVSKMIALGAAMVLAGCGDDGGTLPGECSLDFSGEVSSSFGDAELDALFDATGRFSVAAGQIESSVLSACNAISTDLGGAMGMDPQTACMNAVTQIQAVKAANATAVLSIRYTPAVCSASATAIVDCTAMCDASFDAMATPPTCEGGMLSGSCSGMCSGSCTVEGSVMCTGSCSGSCMGSCDAEVSATCTGTCRGQCEGTCMTMGPDGSCMGECMGTCRGDCMGTIEGDCSGSCDGMCMGSCRSDVMATCMGTCSGSCDVMFTEPRCEGGEWSVMADAECQAACEADASFAVECTEPSLVVTFTGVATMPTDLQALVDTLETNLPRLIAVIEKAQIIVGATVDIAARLPAATDAATSAGVEAVSCHAQAIDAQVQAASQVNVSVMASVSVTAEAGATAM